MAFHTLYRQNADADTLRYWVGLVTEEPLDDLAQKRIEETLTNNILNTPFELTAAEARSEYVLVVAENGGVTTSPKVLTNAVARSVSRYNRRYPDRPDNDAVELAVRPPRRVGTLGSAGVESDLDDARELLRGLAPDAPADAEAVEEGEHA